MFIIDDFFELSYKIDELHNQYNCNPNEELKQEIELFREQLNELIKNDDDFISTLRAFSLQVYEDKKGIA